MFIGIERRPLKAHIKTDGTALTPFWLIFQPFDPLEPVVFIVVCINKGQLEFIAEALVFILTKLILLDWMDVGIVKKYCLIDTRCLYRQYDLTGTGRTTGVQKECFSLTGRCKNWALIVIKVK